MNYPHPPTPTEEYTHLPAPWPHPHVQYPAEVWTQALDLLWPILTKPQQEALTATYTALSKEQEA